MSQPLLSPCRPRYTPSYGSAQRHERRVEDEASQTLTEAVATHDVVPANLSVAIEALRRLDDDALWTVSNSRPAVQDTVLADALIEKRRRQSLTPGEEQLLGDLLDRCDRIMVLRAEADLLPENCTS
jgi:plasmid stability protein